MHASNTFQVLSRKDSTSNKVKPKFSPTFHFLLLDFFFVLLCLFATMTVSYCVAGYRGAASPSAMLLDLWFPVKHNESYIRLFKVRWCTICSPAWKTLSNRDQQKATTSLVSSEYSYSHSDKKADDSLPAQRTTFSFLQFSPEPYVLLRITGGGGNYIKNASNIDAYELCSQNVLMTLGIIWVAGCYGDCVTYSTMLNWHSTGWQWSTWTARAKLAGEN